MSDLTAKLKSFFHSEHNSFKSFEKSLNESVLQSEWIDAVTLFRAGMKKLKANDLTGMEDIKKANESLKVVVNGHKKDEVVKQAEQLNEAIQTVDEKNLSGEVEVLSYELGTLYDKLKEAGMPAMLNEAEMCEGEGCVAEEVAECVVPVTEENPISPTPVVSNPVPQVAPENSTPNSSPNALPTPAAMTTEQKISAYEDGFNEARKRWKMGEMPKLMSKNIVEKELSERSYSYVNRWMEGFNSGFQFQEEVARDTDPKMFEENDLGTSN